MKIFVSTFLFLICHQAIGAIVDLDFDQFNDQLLGVPSTEIPDFVEDGFSIADTGDGSFTAWGQFGTFNQISGVEIFTDSSASLLLSEVNQTNFNVLSVSIVLINGIDIDYPDTTMILKGTKSDNSIVSQNFDLGDRFNDTIQLSNIFEDLVNFEISQSGGLYSLQVASILVEDSPQVTPIPIPPAFLLFASGLCMLFSAHNKLLKFTPATKKRGLRGTAFTAFRLPLSKAL